MKGKGLGRKGLPSSPQPPLCCWEKEGWGWDRASWVARRRLASVGRAGC